GAGSAGSVIAERLSADPHCRVTVLEAGQGLEDPQLLAATANGAELPIGPASLLVRRYRTQLTDWPARSATLVLGATIGGSGAVNGGYFCRGVPTDFDRAGTPGWAWSDVLPYFRAIETDLDFDTPAHGRDGPIPVCRTRERVGATKAFVDAALQAGFAWIADLNDAADASLVGVGAVPLNIIDGTRIGSGAGYLIPALGRPNLALLTQTRVIRLLFHGSRVFGVEAVGRSGRISVTADRIILCAGAIESAHVLMLSGIGDEKMLRAAGIDLVLPAPVGQACSDHPEWLLPADVAVAADRPVLEVVLTTADGLEIRPYTRGFSSIVGQGGVPGHLDRPHIGVALMRPQSRGRITVVSADPLVSPRIEHHYDSEPADVAALRRGVDLVRDVMSTATQLAAPVWATSQHLCGSAPMGAADDSGAVVDQWCRVRGVDGLWVVDGSVLPMITSRGPHASIVMLAHRAAEFIR
ncbi:MAG: mycofactocin system GMC family oxidoreductase MftG, partial [Mycobacteriaceae bacterium]|nr:mycofactocin system GMC family oxidoreductase MftG [Mycobacteriaceae bacterium]